jgi:hypothetical protein
MSAFANNLDPDLLQARWVLGGIDPEQFVEISVSLLECGFDGTALQQLVGLSRPTLRDLGDLPTGELRTMWAGKSSLMDVIRAERKKGLG